MPKFAVTYPVAIVASVLLVCFTAMLIVAIDKGQDLQAILGALGAFLTAVGGIYAHSKVTPLARPQDDNGTPLAPVDGDPVIRRVP